MLTAAIYARKSTEQIAVADESRSVTRQIDQARAYAARKGWNVVDQHIYVDDGVSGAEFANRPGFVRLMNALRPRAPFGVLIVSELSRLGREQLATGYAVKQLSQANVRIISYLEDREILLDTPTDKFLLAAVSFAAEIEREKARQRTHDALHRKAVNGYVTGGRVFGYENVRTAAGVRRVVNQPEAAIVERIFELAADGHGHTAIAKMLNAAGALSPRAQQGRPSGWADNSVREILRRPLYRGEVIWNQTRKRDSWGAKRIADRPASEHLRHDAPQLRIISDDLWNRAHAQLDVNRQRYNFSTGQAGRRSGAKYLLTGLLQCSSCGGSFEVRTRSHGRVRVPFYGCQVYSHRGTAVCSNRLTVSMERANEAVLSELKRSLLDPAVLEQAIAAAAERLADDATPGDDSATVELSRLELELARLTSAVATGGAELSSLLAAIRQRESRRVELSLEVERRRRQRRPVISDAKAIAADLRSRVENHWRELLTGHAASGNRVLRQVILGRLTMKPNGEGAQAPFYTFRGTGTLWPIISGMIPQNLASPTGFEPVF